MKISAKIVLTTVALVMLTTVAILATSFIQQQRLERQIQDSVRQQAFSEGAKIAQTAYWLCASTEARNQKRLSHSLGVARQLVQEAGTVNLSTNTVTWTAVNQFTKQPLSVTLPKMLVGERWLGQVATTNEPALIVDETRRLTREFCTIFQRINEAGDMLRVSTSVLQTDGRRAIGTFIPAKNPDGAANPVVSAVLRGETYRGRAFVVNEWHAAAYEPIWDAGRKQIIGMLYVGIGLEAINRELHDAITEITVGKTGYIYVLGTQGDQRGRYVVSQKGKRDGENIWDAKDADGRLFIQSIIEKGLKTKDGATDFETYAWKNPGETSARLKFAAITSFAPWGWVIGAGAYEDDFADVIAQMRAAQKTMLGWVSVVAGLAVLFAAGAGYLLTRGITRPLLRIVASVGESSAQTNVAAEHIAATSQSLAEGASEQAASLEETSASLEEISSMTRRNAQNVQSAKDFTAQTRATADSGAKSTQEMGQAMQGIRTASNEMREAMNGIKAASNDVSKIIKTIDEIAFQTNILALNAAVEAARAGEAGMGFAVVADEVRNLAQRSAKAAKETADMIETSIKRSDDGVRVTDKVVASVEEVAAKSHELEAKLAEIVAKAQKVDEQVAQIASASNEQSQGISEVNMAVSQMDQVTQSNAANAEESAAAAEELNAQAEVLKDAVHELQQLVGGAPKENVTPSQAKAVVAQTFRSGPNPTKARPKSSGTPKPSPHSGSVPNDLDIPMPEPLGVAEAKGSFKDF